MVWNTNRRDLPEVRSMTDTRNAHCAARLRSKALRNEGLLCPDDYVAIVQFLANDPFYSGKTSREGWMADLGWLTKSDDNVIRILERLRRSHWVSAGSANSQRKEGDWDGGWIN